MADSKAAVTAYVRLVMGSENESLRRISIPRPDDITSLEWLAAGYAIDGNSVIRDVDTKALAVQESELVQFLADHDYEVDFQ